MNYDPNNPTPPPPPGGPLTPTPPIPPTGNKAAETIDDIASTLRELFNRVPDTVNKAVERALNVRDTTVVVRLSEASSDAIDQLVSAGIYKSRSEAASFLVDEGIKGQAALFQRIQEKMSEIERLRAELRNTVAP